MAALILHAHRLVGDLVSSNNDLRVHYRWTVEFVTAVRGGDPYPRWMPLANQGLGEPALLFYAPLYYYATAVVGYFTRDTWTAMKLVEFVGIWASGLFAYAALRRLCPLGWSLAGAVTVQAAPMIFMLFHFFNGLPWALSFTAAMAAVAFSVRPAPRRVVDVPLAAALAVVVSTHTLSGLMVLICLPFVNVRHLVGPANSAGRTRPVIAWGVSALLGVGLTMVYLFPALRARHLIMSEAWVTEYTYYNAFIFSTVTYVLYGMRWMTFQWPLPLVLLGSTIAATWYVVKSQERRDGSWAALAGLVSVAWVSLFLCSELSYPLWALPSPLKLVQYPHRFLYVTTAVGLVANVICLQRVWSENYARRVALLVALPLVGSVLMTGTMYAKFTLVDARPSGIRGDTVGPHRGLPEYLTRTVGPDWERYVQDGGLDSECAARRAKCHETAVSGRTRRWRMDAREATTIRLPVFAFPAWTVGLDGRALTSTIDQSTGLIAIELPAGRHEVSLTWAGLPSERTGLVLSGVSLGLLMGLAAMERFTRAKGGSQT
ncbi:MAG: hypothetical protein E6G47_11035 [Actinobacteria bacterium]|nr:MAG: hypothetical protein E6G47_11035 [Actinomycetota bacterium]